MAAREDNVDSDSEAAIAKKAWAAWLGFYKGYCGKFKLTKEQLVRTSAEVAASMGFNQIPALNAMLIGKMGLKGTPGLRIDNSPPARGGQGRGGGGNQGQGHGQGQGRPSSQGHGGNQGRPSSRPKW